VRFLHVTLRGSIYASSSRAFEVLHTLGIGAIPSSVQWAPACGTAILLFLGPMGRGRVEQCFPALLGRIPDAIPPDLGELPREVVWGDVPLEG
jgi:hypothetical protein